MKKALIILSFVLFGATVGFAQTPDTLRLSLDSCIQMALRNSYDIKVSEKLKEKAKAEREAVLSMFFPKIGVNASAIYMFKDIELMEDLSKVISNATLASLPVPIDPNTEQILELIRQSLVGYLKPIDISLKGAYMAGVTLQQPIFAGGRIVNGMKMAELGGKMAEENARMKRHEAIISAQQSYWLYVSVMQKTQLAKTYENLLLELEKMVQNVRDVDMINRSDLLKIQVQRAEVQLQVQRAEAGLELSRMALCLTIGVDFSTPILPTDTTIEVREISALPSDDDLNNRPEYRLLQMQAEMKEREARNVLGEYLPTVGLAATFGYIGGMKIMDYKLDPYNISNVMVVASMPIMDWWGGSKKLKSAKIDKEIASIEMQKNSQLLRLQIQQATSELINSYSALKNSQKAMTLAEENLRVSEDRYSVSMETLTELMMSQAAWKTAKSNLIDAQINCRQKEAEYLKAIGQIE